MKNERKIALQIDLFTKDGKVNEVRQSAYLGNQALTKDADGAYKCTGVYFRAGSVVPVTFDLLSLGTVADKEVPNGTMVQKDAKFDALSWLDEPEKKEALTDDERKELQHIGVLELNQKVIDAIVNHAPTAMSDAAMAIMQHAYQGGGTFPKSTLVPGTDHVVGDHTDGAAAVLTIGGHTFTVDDPWWDACEYKVCGDRELYRFTWKNVPASVLDELSQ